MKNVYVEDEKISMVNMTLGRSSERKNQDYNIDIKVEIY